MIRFDSVRYFHPGGSCVFDGLGLSIAMGSSTTVIGPSGCGKTTFLNLIAGLVSPQSGAVTISGSTPKSRRLEMSLIPQDYGLFPWKTALDNAALGLIIRHVPSAKARETALATLDSMGLSAIADRYPSHLSGGQCQRVAIARALATEPKLLLMDEPFSALDALTREDLQDTILSQWRKQRFSMIMVTHSIEEAVYLGNTVMVMGSGGHVSVLRFVHSDTCDYRKSQEYFQRCVEVRRVLETQI